MFLSMSLADLIITIVIGALIGFLASLIMKSSHGFWLSCLIGIIGSVIGSWLFAKLGIRIGTGLVNQIITGVAGSCILIALLRLIMGRRF